MASHRGAAAIAAYKGQEISSLGSTSGSDAGRLSEKKEGFDEKNGDVVFESSMAEDQLPPYRDLRDSEETEAIHHPADKDDILTHTIHVEDPTLNAITFRTIFLGKFRDRNQSLHWHFLQSLPGNRYCLEPHADLHNRNWALFIWRNNLGHLLFQALNCLRLHCVSRSHHLYAGRAHGLYHSQEGNNRSMAQPSPFQCERASCHCHLGQLCLYLGSWYRSIGCGTIILRQ
jgi:hypothetical protein